MSAAVVTDAAVVAAARTQLQVPWVHQARMWGQQLDCAGLIICTARHLGLVAPDFDVNGYSRTPDGTMLDFCARYMTRIWALELGAVLCVATDRDPQHLGFVGNYVHGGWSFIHSTNAGRCRCTEARLAFGPNFKRRAIFRLPGVVPAAAGA